jgi:hypothetical protein
MAEAVVLSSNNSLLRNQIALELSQNSLRIPLPSASLIRLRPDKLANKKNALYTHIFFCQCTYSNVPNKRTYTFISSKVCLLSSIKVKRLTLSEINMYTRLFGILEYVIS